MIDEVKRICGLYGLKTQECEVKTGKGKNIPSIAVLHGVHRVVVLDYTSYLLMVIALDFKEEEAEALSKLPEKEFRKIMMITRLEMLQGRTGFNILADGQTLKRIQLEQRIRIVKNEPSSAQRMVDGIQELVTVSVRVGQILGSVLGSITSTVPQKPDSGSSDDVMFR